MAVREKLLKTLEELGEDEFDKFKWHLQLPDNLQGSSGIPKSHLDKADMRKTVDKIVETYKQHQSVEVVKKILEKIDRNDLVEKVSNTNTGDMDPDLTIVLLGHSGVGKSASGNSILRREVFLSKQSCKPVTAQICEQIGSVFGKNISVIDTPGILCAGAEEKIKTFCLNLLRSSRPKLFLVLLRVGRFTEDDQKAVEAALRVVGDQQFGTCYLLFTGGDALKNITLDEFINEDAKGPLPHLVQKFSGRYHMFNNMDRGQKQVRELLLRSDTKTPVSSSPCGVSLTGSIMATSNVSSKYEDIKSKSILISPGPPAVYQMKPKEKKFGTLTRKTVGEKNLNKTNRTILLIGETGTGKSTLINTLFNYTVGVEFDDNIWFKIVEDEKRSQSESQTSDEEEGQHESQTSDEKRSQSESQTSDVIVYQIFGFEDKTLPFSLTIIDTPGYGNTRGIEHDVIISERLFDLFRSVDGVHEINAVGLVLQAGVNRLSDRLKYIFDSVTSLFGKDIEKNIVALITRSNGVTPQDVLEALVAANIKCAKNEKTQPVYFLFDNCQDEQRTEEDEFALENAWRVTERGMKRFTDFLENSKPQKLITTVEVLRARIRITACINNLQDRIELIELKQNEIQQTEEALKKHEQEMKKNEEFTVEVDEVYKDKEDIRGGRRWLWFYKGAVTCNICKENCHHPGCTMAWYPEHCEVMKRGRCTVCTEKCPAEDHVKEKWIYVNKTRKVKKTLQDVKQKYENNKAENEKEMNVMENLQTEMKKLNAEKIKLLDEAYQHVLTLEEIALNVNSLSTYVHLDFLTEKMNERGDTEKVKKLEEMKCRVDEGTKAGLQYMYGKLKAVGKAVKNKVK